LASGIASSYGQLMPFKESGEKRVRKYRFRYKQKGQLKTLMCKTKILKERIVKH